MKDLEHRLKNITDTEGYHIMYDKFFDLKGEALDERRERKKLGQVAHCIKLKWNRGYLVTSLPKELHEKWFSNSKPMEEEKK